MGQEKCISPAEAAKVTKLSTSAIYKALRKRTIFSIKSSINGRPYYEIPIHDFKNWHVIEIERLKKEIAECESRIKVLHRGYSYLKGLD